MLCIRGWKCKTVGTGHTHSSCGRLSMFFKTMAYCVASNGSTYVWRSTQDTSMLANWKRVFTPPLLHLLLFIRVFSLRQLALSVLSLQHKHLNDRLQGINLAKETAQSIQCSNISRGNCCKTDCCLCDSSCSGAAANKADTCEQPRRIRTRTSEV